MSVRFDNTYLPEDAIMYIYNEDTRFVVGPIDMSDFKNGTFRSDYLNGDYVTLSIFLPGVSSDNIEIHINTYDHGIIAFKSYDDDFGTSGSCNINVACENGWECQSESVCKIIHSSIGSCTGSLINNDCCDLTPYILTADHCLRDRFGHLNDFSDYIFRFNYQSPQCSPNGETSPSQWIVYFGSELRANWGNTDFGLLQLEQQFEPAQGISFSGWDRVNLNTSNSTCIHHPSGDVKKICFDDNPNILSGDYHRVVWDHGTTEGGSSGSPLFNDDSRIIGQLRGGTASCSNQNGWDEYGRFDLSWEGNGTNNTRLRNWLGASTNPNTMDCMASPYISGPNMICDKYYALYLLYEEMPCQKNITWDVGPSNLFAIGMPSSGIGNLLTVKCRNGASGLATVTYTLSSSNCNDAVLTHDFWVGKPEQPQYFLQKWYDYDMERITLSVPPVPGATSYNWTVENLTFNNRSNFEKFHFEACPSNLYDIRFSVSAVNACGESSRLYGRIERNCGFHTPKLTSPVTVYPNPSNSSYVIVARHSDDIKQKDIEEATLIGELLSIDGRTLRKFEMPHYGQYRIDDLTAGVYLLKMYDGKDVLSIQKIVVF